MDKFQNRYRIQSTRLENWDYGWDAAYFITICTKDRECFFGAVDNEIMQLSHVGVIADICWYEIKNHAKNVELGEFVVMPNHIHGIIILTQPSQPSINNPLKTIAQQRFQNQGKNSISSIVGGYKSAVTKHANRLGYNFGWQSRFHDHIIRDDQSFHNISEYIINNPRNWSKDKFYF